MFKRPQITKTMVILCVFLTACQAQIDQPPSATPMISQTQTGIEQILRSNSPTKTPTLPMLFTQTETIPGEMAAPESVLTSTQHGVTVVLTNLQISDGQTTLDFIAQIDPVWGFTFEQYESPPQQIYISQPPTITDETGQVFQPKSYHGWGSSQKYIDPKTNMAVTGGTFVFDPITSSKQLEISMQIELQVVKVAAPIRFTLTNPDQAQPIQIDRQLTFGELSPSIRSAQWNGLGLFSLTVEGSVEENNLIPVCLYLFQDPQWPSPGYSGCSYQEGVPADLTGKINLGSSSKSSEPLEVHAAVNIVFMEPFKFIWVRAPK